MSLTKEKKSELIGKYGRSNGDTGSAEVQVALQDAAALVTGETGDALKERLRTGTVVTNDDRNWELRYTQERRRINLSRAIAVDMESGTVAANGSPAFGQYKPSESGEGYEPWALIVLELAAGRIRELTFFLSTERLFSLFGLPPRLDA